MEKDGKVRMKERKKYDKEEELREETNKKFKKRKLRKQMNVKKKGKIYEYVYVFGNSTPKTQALRSPK